MKPMTIFTRLVIGNIIILVLILGMGALVSYDLMRLQSLNRDILGRQQESLAGTEQIEENFQRLVSFDEKFFVTRDRDYFNRFNQQKILVDNAFKTLYPFLETIGQKSGFDRTVNSFQAYLAWFTANAKPVTEDTVPEFDTLSRQRGPMKVRVLTGLMAMEAATRSLVTRKTERSGEMTRQIFFITVVTTLLTVFTGMMITLINTRSVRNAVGRLQVQTRDISRGRFEEIKNIQGPKEIQDLADHFNLMCRRLSELDELKADFINHVSHELRTPMTSIKEAAVMLSKGYYANQPQKQSQLFELINGECARLLNSVMRLLDFSKMEAGKMEYRKDPVQLPDVLRKSILRLAPLAQKKKISLEFEPPRSDLPRICGDEDRMIEVMDNLIGNGLKFTPEGGTVTVDCRLEGQGDILKVRVTDDGPGIALDHLEKIFYKFNQIDCDQNTRMGTGLGLSISKYIISAHGGDIWAENVEAGGTRVSFTLPASS
ncbi:MAG: sensor histidine kinase [Desulfobacter sp.]|nr:MAG: sensor histidine kinase [Desulfobacter sp.]